MAAPIPGFTRLTPSISFYRPEDSSSKHPGDGKNNHPNLIVLCTWMAAHQKHITKYTTSYRLLFPQTPILLLQCSVSAVLHTSSTQHFQNMVSARDIILNTPGRPILHAFSNGGSTIASHLSIQLQGKENWNGWEKVILDCTPSTPTVTGAVDAIAFSLPSNPVLRILGRLILRLIISTYLLLYVRMWGGEDGVTWIRRILNTPKFFSTKARRLYVYSGEDALVQDWAVAQHAQDARDRGYVVREERFERGAHCALGVGEGGERYWGFVRGFLVG